MTTTKKEIYLIRVPAPLDLKTLEGEVIDLSRTISHLPKKIKIGDTDTQLICEVDKNQSQENINIIKLSKTSETELKVDDSTQFSGYINFRVKRDIGSDSEEYEPLPKRHVVEPIETYIKDTTSERPKGSPKKKKRRKQK